MKPAFSNAASTLSPCGPYMVLRNCSPSRNRKGSEGIIDSGTMPWKAAVLTRTMSSAPILTCSMVSFSEPSELSPNTLMLYLPPVALESSSPMCFTAMLVGKSLECTSAERKSRALAAVAVNANVVIITKLDNRLTGKPMMPPWRMDSACAVDQVLRRRALAVPLNIVVATALRRMDTTLEYVLSAREGAHADHLMCPCAPDSRENEPYRRTRSKEHHTADVLTWSHGVTFCANAGPAA